jgi:hypothetical protein
VGKQHPVFVNAESCGRILILDRFQNIEEITPELANLLIALPKLLM